MYLKKTKRKGRVYLSVVQNYRRDGKVRSKTVEALGYVDELEKRYPDPVAYFQAYVNEKNRQASQAGEPVHLTIGRNARIEPHSASAVSLGGAISLGYADAFACGRLFGGGGTGRIFELLLVARMMHAVPIRDTWNNRLKFLRALDMPYSDVYRAFEVYAQSSRTMVDNLNARYVELRGPRHRENVRLVLSNYTFRRAQSASAGGPDELVSSEFARLCLVIDAAGIPLTYRIVNRDLTGGEIVDLMADLKRETGASRVTLVAAQIPAAEWVMDAISRRGDGYVLLQPAELVSRELNEWISDDAGYAVTRNGAYRIKSRIADRREGPTSAKEIALRSASAESASAFCIVTNETTRSDAAVFNIYRELWRVHEPFQIIPADFIAMPYQVDSATHIQAHFAICYAAFFVLRVLRQGMNWHYDAAQVADALLGMEGAYLDENWYVFNYRTGVTDAIQESVGMDVGRRLMSRADIRNVAPAVAKAVTDGNSKKQLANTP